MDENQTLDRLARISIAGLQYCVVDAPRHADAVQKTMGQGLWIDDGPGIPDNVEVDLPSPPEGCFTHWFFVQEWNAFIHIRGRDAKLVWIEDKPRAVKNPTLRWSGDEIPDP